MWNSCCHFRAPTTPPAAMGRRIRTGKARRPTNILACHNLRGKVGFVEKRIVSAPTSIRRWGFFLSEILAKLTIHHIIIVITILLVEEGSSIAQELPDSTKVYPLNDILIIGVSEFHSPS